MDRGGSEESQPPAALLAATGTQILEIECREQPGRLRELIKAYFSDSEIRAELMKLRQLARRGRTSAFHRNGRVVL